MIANEMGTAMPAMSTERGLWRKSRMTSPMSSSAWKISFTRPSIVPRTNVDWSKTGSTRRPGGRSFEPVTIFLIWSLIATTFPPGTRRTLR